MEDLTLVVPDMACKEQVMAFKAEMLEAGSSFDGCNGLNEVEDTVGLGETGTIQRYWITVQP